MPIGYLARPAAGRTSASQDGSGKNFMAHGLPLRDKVAGRVKRPAASQMRNATPSVILSAAKDLMAIASGVPVEMP
jgi:hypothetical protein